MTMNGTNTTWYNDTFEYDDNVEPPPPFTALDVAYALVRYLFPVIILVGTTGNMLSAAVMLRRSMRTTSIYCYQRVVYLLLEGLVDVLLRRCLL